LALADLSLVHEKRVYIEGNQPSKLSIQPAIRVARNEATTIWLDLNLLYMKSNSFVGLA
jgi:hypothetical protein